MISSIIVGTVAVLGMIYVFNKSVVEPLVQIPIEMVDEVKDYLTNIEISSSDQVNWAQVWKSTSVDKLNKYSLTLAACDSPNYDDQLLKWFKESFKELETTDVLETKGQWERQFYKEGKGYTRIGFVIAKKNNDDKYDLLVACKQNHYQVAWKASLWNIMGKYPPAEIENNGGKRSIEWLVHQQSQIELVQDIERKFGENDLIGISRKENSQKE